MMKERILIWLYLLLGIVVIVLAVNYLINTVLPRQFRQIGQVMYITPTPSENKEKQLYKISRVVDGDTVVAEIDGKTETIRLIGMDAPEMKSTNDDQCFAREASQRARELLADRRVEMVADETQDDRDIYERLLRYIVFDDGINFSEQMIGEGYAKEYTYKIPYKFQSSFRAAQQIAREAGIGLWGSCR